MLCEVDTFSYYVFRFINKEVKISVFDCYCLNVHFFVEVVVSHEDKQKSRYCTVEGEIDRSLGEYTCRSGFPINLKLE